MGFKLVAIISSTNKWKI